MKKKLDVLKNRCESRLKRNREYRNSIFVDILSRDKKTRHSAAISLYNAWHTEKIGDDAKIKFFEIKNILYHKEKNDVAFMVNGKIMVLVEHQSTINENMPLRFLLYIATLYQMILETRCKYKQHLVKIPKPEFYVIYNGRQEYCAFKQLKLSDAFEEQGMNPPLLELIVPVININHPDNKGFLEKCEVLKAYKEFGDVMHDFMRRYGDKGYDMGIEYCIHHGILSDYLNRNRKERHNMLKSKYSYKTELMVAKQEAREEGKEEGRAEGRAEGKEEGKAEGRAEGFLEVVQAMKKKRMLSRVHSEHV